jgi:hypothetical protein
MTLIHVGTLVALVANWFPKLDGIILFGYPKIYDLDIIGYSYQDERMKSIYQELLVA